MQRGARWAGGGHAAAQSERSRLMWRELELGMWMMGFNVAFAVSWLWLVDPYTPVRHGVRPCAISLAREQRN